MNTDRIEKKIVLNSSLERVWQAISDSTSFGTWFGVEFEGPFVAGESLNAKIVGTKVDPEVAALQEPHRGYPFQFHVETIQPMKRFAFRWHPYAIDRNQDYSQEPMTLVSFDLAEVADWSVIDHDLAFSIGPLSAELLIAERWGIP